MIIFNSKLLVYQRVPQVIMDFNMFQYKVRVIHDLEDARYLGVAPWQNGTPPLKFPYKVMPQFVS